MTQPTLLDFISHENEKPKMGEGSDGNWDNKTPTGKIQNKSFLAVKSNTMMTDGEYREKYWETVQMDPRKLLKYYYQRNGKGSEIADLILHGYHNDKRRRKEKNIDELDYDDLRGNWYLLYKLALIWKDEQLGINHDFKPDEMVEAAPEPKRRQ